MVTVVYADDFKSTGASSTGATSVTLPKKSPNKSEDSACRDKFGSSEYEMEISWETMVPLTSDRRSTSIVLSASGMRLSMMEALDARIDEFTGFERIKWLDFNDNLEASFDTLRLADSRASIMFDLVAFL